MNEDIENMIQAEKELNNISESKQVIIKSNKQLADELKNIGVFSIKNNQYLCEGYDFEITKAFIEFYELILNKN